MQVLESENAASKSRPGGNDKPVAGAAWIAHKFGGTSLADADCIRQVAAILRARPEQRQAVVVSAMRGVTDALLGLANAASRRQSGWQDVHAQLRERHLRAARDLLGGQSAPAIEWLDQQFLELGNMLHALSVLGAPGREALERIQGLGEFYSAYLLSTYLRGRDEPVACLDARDVLVVRHGDLGVVVDWPQSAQRLAAWREAHPQPRVIITGFIASDDAGRATILGRNGSDFSGAIFAALFEASELHIWTDVDGILSADPRLVPEAVPLATLSYQEAFELAYFGAKVIHPQTLTPVLARNVPVIIRNTFKPEFEGTRITATSSAADGPVKALTLCEDLALLNVEGAAMIGVPGTAQRVFDALRRADVSVVMISQGSSEQSICCVVRAAESSRAERALRDAFEPELQRGQIQRIVATPDICVLAAVGDGMAGTPGVAARLFGALARARVNVCAIAQGASERNISVAITSHDATRALRAAHASFWLSPQTISIGVVGSGKVGQALLEQLREAIPRLRREAGLDLRVRALANSRHMWLDELGAGASDWSQRLREATTACDLDAFTAHVHTDHLPHAIIIDCSASDIVAARYAGWLEQGIHVVTPNKHAGAGPLDRYEAIRKASLHTGARFRYEATVGAGLPVIQTLRDLIDTGDALQAVEGIFSGTLAWLFNSFDGSQPFSQLVLEALALGYTEPDPRDDLSGTDVARKLVILAREAGLALSVDDVEVESLVPASLASASPAEFLARLSEADAAMSTRHAAAKQAGKVLRYVARLDQSGKASVGLAEIGSGHAFAHLRLTDNIVQFTTRRYANNPLVVQGPGAGPEVTAAGVFADLLRVSAALGARL
jgi:aspartokinase/homoserine dehydrogenase 1